MKEDTENLIHLERVKGRIELLSCASSQIIPKQILNDLEWMEERLRAHMVGEKSQLNLHPLTATTTHTPPGFGVIGSSAAPSPIMNGDTKGGFATISFEHFESTKNSSGGGENLDAWRKVLKEKLGKKI